MTVGIVSPRSGSLSALRLVQSSRNAQRLAQALVVGLILSVVAMLFVRPYGLYGRPRAERRAIAGARRALRSSRSAAPFMAVTSHGRTS